MKTLLLSALLMLGAALTACSGSSDASADANDSTAVEATETSETQPIDNDARIYYDGAIDTANALIVISKRDLRLTVYATVGADTLRIADYPVCVGKNKGQKTKSGDMCTPESEAGKPFKIKQIQDAHDWCHDFGDGRGSILSYGNWFMRLETPFNGIGIHGSTNNEQSVPGRGSEGCIRLRDADIIHLKEHYARVAMPVIIKGETQGPLAWERHVKNADAKGHKITASK
ncbi:MAG: L,D-transpeptidase [Muribaculaceae bacterium]